MKIKMPKKPQPPDRYELMPYWADSYPVRGVEIVKMQIGGHKIKGNLPSGHVSAKSQLLFFKEVFKLNADDIRQKFGRLCIEEDEDEYEEDDEDEYGWYPEVTVTVLREFARRFNVKEEAVYVDMGHNRYTEPDMFLCGTRPHTEEEIRAAREPYERAEEEYEKAKAAYNAEIESLRLAYPFMKLPELIP